MANTHEAILVRIHSGGRARIELNPYPLRSVSKLPDTDAEQAVRRMLKAVNVTEVDANRMSRRDLQNLLRVQKFEMNHTGQVTYVAMRLSPSGDVVTTSRPHPSAVSTKSHQLPRPQRRWWLPRWWNKIRVAWRKFWPPWREN